MYKEIPSPSPYYPVNHGIRERNPRQKKKKKTKTKKGKSAVRHVRTDFQSMMSDERLYSWRRFSSYGNKSINLQSKSMDWFLYESDLCDERVNALLVYVLIDYDIFVDYYRK